MRQIRDRRDWYISSAFKHVATKHLLEKHILALKGKVIKRGKPFWALPGSYEMQCVPMLQGYDVDSLGEIWDLVLDMLDYHDERWRKWNSEKEDWESVSLPVVYATLEKQGFPLAEQSTLVYWLKRRDEDAESRDSRAKKDAQRRLGL